MKKLNRKILWDRGGVSEVIGTILTLSITVVLFSGVILMVDQFPAPGDNIFSDFQATVEPWENITGAYLGSYIHITNTGGQQMVGMWTVMVLTIDHYTYSLDTQGVLDAVNYGLGENVPGHRGNDNGDDNWDTGERWTLRRNSTMINEDSNIGVMIMDLERNALVWTASIQGAKNEFGPIITKIRADSDIRTLRSDPIDYGREFYVFAEVYDPDGDLDVTSVYMDLSSINATYTHINMTDPDGDGVFRGGPIMGPVQIQVPIGYHMAIVRAQDLEGVESIGSGRVAVGQDLGGQPNLVIRGYDIEVSTPNPINGQTILISATVKNHGGWCHGIMDFFDVIGTQRTLIDSENFTISDYPDQVMKTISWEANSGGNHTIRVEVRPVGAADADLSDNHNETLITVMPTILLVDDDNHVSDLTPLDTVSYMRSSLDSCNFQYDLYTVGRNNDGPGYEFGETKLMDYDVVIWMTGYEKKYTLTAKDQQNITSFLNDDIGRGRTGSLWLIGQYLNDDASVPDSFFQNVMKASALISSAAGPTDPLRGVDGNPISDDWESKFIPIIDRVPEYNNSYFVDPGPGAEVTFKDSSSANPPIRGDTINYENVALDSRIVFSPWEFSRIQKTSDQTQVAYKTILWLGNISVIFGNDLAISEQNINPEFVFYNQNVMVDAIIRNNGIENLTTEAVLFLDDVPVMETFIRDIFVPGMGGTAYICTNWTASSLGTHVLKWYVDPDNFISETNEGNNQVPSYVSSGEVFVEFRIMVVDDDASLNNNGTLYNDTAFVTDSLGRLGYTYESVNGTNTTHVVEATKHGPTTSVLSNYSAVIWVTGESVGGLTAQDSLSLEDYVLNFGGRVWLIGSDVWSLVAASNFTTLMGIDSTMLVPDAGISGTLRGVDESNISHGMNYSIASNPLTDILTPLPGAEGVFYQDYQTDKYSAIAFEDSYKGLSCAFNFSTLYGADSYYIEGDNATDELTYMVLRWFDKPDERKEVRITEQDYFVSDEHPQIGEAYVVRARVHNVGAEDANVLVRFMDGDTQIGADSISVSPGNFTSAEIIWRPLFAGLRTISFIVDPVNEEAEVFEWFNNNISFQTYVYFFWDDMESGDSKWSHGSTIININGESPLNYYSEHSNVHTDIMSDWDWSMTYGTVNTSRIAHSYPNSYFMEEGTGLFGEPSDVLVGIVIDNSPSMMDRICSDGSGRTYLRVAKDAAIGMINGMSDESAVGVYYFKGANEWPVINITDLAGTGRDDVIDAINNTIKEEQGNTNTAIWDAIGEQYMDVKTASMLPQYADHYAAVVSLGDGADYQAADSSAFKVQSLEAGSDAWAPWGDMLPEMGYPTGNYADHWGKYWFYKDALPGIWRDAGSYGGAWKPNRMGLLNSDVPIYTIGLALEHYSTPYANEADPMPAEGSSDTHTHTKDTESGTVEYNFWRIANTSNAEYFYSEDGSDLEDIFTTIGQIIANSGFNQTRASAQQPTTKAVENYDKRVVTQTFSLEGMESADLSFWHRYNILQGGNGAFIQVGYDDDHTVDSDGDGIMNNDWKWKYIIPPGQYTGMLYYEYQIEDSFGNRIQWCWNGVSDDGSFGWEYADMDIISYVPEEFRSNVKIAFNYTQFGGGTGVGWYIDDVNLVVSRNATAIIDGNMKDVWAMSNMSHSGNYSWSNIDPTTGYIKTGVDNSLMTTPIDLTNARNAYLSAYFKFNFNEDAGIPPDGFRVEISQDGGITWNAVNLGARACYGISGTDDDIDDGVMDGRAYTGLPESGDTVADDYWVNASSLTRLNLDLSAWSGNQILIRFRVVTNDLGDILYPHNNNVNYGTDPGFGGFYIDDVQVFGETIFG